MLTKCVCASCGHAFLAEEDFGPQACPRCKVPGPTPDEPFFPSRPNAGMPASFPEDPAGPDFHREPAGGFAPKAPPPMILTRERLGRGVVFGALTAGSVGAVLTAALASVSVRIPGVVPFLFALLAGLACRAGFAGRTAYRTRHRALAASILVALLGFAGTVTGSWLVDRFTGDRATPTRADLERGLKSLVAQRASTEDAGLEVLLEQRIAETERLRLLSDAQIEDYLWIQEGQVNQPLLAYAKIKASTRPVLQLGPNSDPVRMPGAVPLAILAAEVMLAAIVVWRSVAPPRA